MAKQKSKKKSLERAFAAFDKQLDLEFQDALQATLKAIEASRGGAGVVGKYEDKPTSRRSRHKKRG
jgi:hypothetical protein